MKRIRIIADKFFEMCEITSLPISQDKINEIIEMNGWELRYYSTSKPIISRLELNEYADTHDGFTYAENGRIIIFIRDELYYLEKINVICHEIGHIVLGHTSYNGVLGKNKDKNYEDALENEADIFSLEFQAPIFILLQKNYDTAEKIFNAGILNKEMSEIQYRELLEYKDKSKSEKLIFKYKIRLTGMFLIMTACVLFVVYTQASNNSSDKTSAKTNTQNYIETVIQTKPIDITIEPTTESEITELTFTQSYPKVKVTKSGKKYHLPDCRYINHKNNITELEIEEALRIGYTPCTVCFPK